MIKHIFMGKVLKKKYEVDFDGDRFQLFLSCGLDVRDSVYISETTSITSYEEVFKANLKFPLRRGDVYLHGIEYKIVEITVQENGDVVCYTDYVSKIIDNEEGLAKAQIEQMELRESFHLKYNVKDKVEDEMENRDDDHDQNIYAKENNDIFIDKIIKWFKKRKAS